MRRVLPLLLLSLSLTLSGCAGYVADRFRSRIGVISPQLLRFGLDVPQARCVGENLSQGLSRQRVRQFQQLASAVQRGYFEPTRLTPRDLREVARGLREPQAVPVLNAAYADCGVADDPQLAPTRIAEVMDVASIPLSPPEETPDEALGRRNRQRERAADRTPVQPVETAEVIPIPAPPPGRAEEPGRREPVQTEDQGEWTPLDAVPNEPGARPRPVPAPRPSQTRPAPAPRPSETRIAEARPIPGDRPIPLPGPGVALPPGAMMAPAAGSAATSSAGAIGFNIPPAARSTSTGGIAATWLNLGAATTGQQIAVDAASIQQDGGTRSAWFRMTDPESGQLTGNNFKLLINCEARQIRAIARRRVDRSGQITDYREYSPESDPARAVDGGTVEEIAFLSLCT